MLICLRDLKWSLVARGLFARKLTRGGTRCRNVGLCSFITDKNVAGSKLGRITWQIFGLKIIFKFFRVTCLAHSGILGFMTSLQIENENIFVF